MEKQFKSSLKFINPKKVRVSKNKKSILLFISDDLVLSVNINYLTKIISSKDDDFLPKDSITNENEVA